MKKISRQISRAVDAWEALDGTVFDTRDQCEDYEKTYIRNPAEDAAKLVPHKFVRVDDIESFPEDTNMFLLFRPKTENDVAIIKNWMSCLQCWLEVDGVSWDKIRINSTVWFDVEIEYGSSADDLSCVCDVYNYRGTTEDVICGYVRRVEKYAKELEDAQ